MTTQPKRENKNEVTANFYLIWEKHCKTKNFYLENSLGKLDVRSRIDYA